MAIETLKAEIVRLTDTEGTGRLAPIDSAADALQGGLRSAWQSLGPQGRVLKDLLHGTWLGHPLHPVLTDVPIGAWTLGVLFDLLGWRTSADRAFTVGVVAAVPTALAGATDWGETEGKQRRVGLMHALLNSTALVGFVASLLARRSGARGLGVALSTSAYSIASLSAWLGGKLVYEQGTGVSRTAWEPSAPTGFKVVLPANALLENTPARADVTIEGQTVPLVLLRRGGAVHALSGTCTHWGGPLWEGRVVDGADGTPCIECPWHASTFNMATGYVVRGPATQSQPLFEARLRAGNVEVRRAPLAAESPAAHAPHDHSTHSLGG